jgi:hypothetical protein
MERILSFREFALDESLAKNADWDAYARAVSEAYMAAPDYDSSAVHHWEALNRSNHILYKRLLSKVEVEFTEEDPYPDQPTMKREVERTGVLKVYSGDNEHPYFSAEDNLVFRAVHDYITHILTNTPFGLKGEVRAANTHLKMVPADARPALFTEVVGQVCAYIVTGKFQKQKIAVLDGFSYTNLGEITAAAKASAAV